MLNHYDVHMKNDLAVGIGPHEGRELELMLAGKKPLAMFHDDIPDDMEPPEVSFDFYVKKGRLVKQEIVLPISPQTESTLRYYFFSLPGEEWRMARLIEIQRGFFEDGVQTTPELEIEIGRLLGYDDTDVQAFIGTFFDS